MKHFRLAVIFVYMTLFFSIPVSGAVVAKIGNTNFNSLQKAVEQAKSNQTIVLQKNVLLTKELSFDRNRKALTLDLNQHTIKIKSDGYIIIGTDSVIFKNGTIQQLDPKSSPDETVIIYGTLTIKSGKYISNGGVYGNVFYVTPEGRLLINGGDFIFRPKAKKDHDEYYYPTIIENRGFLQITNGKFHSNAEIVQTDFDKCIIRGGTFYTSRILCTNDKKKKSKIVISSGTFKCPIIAKNTDVRITNGKLSKISLEHSKLTMTGGTFSGYGPLVTLYEKSTFIMKDGTLKAKFDPSSLTSGVHLSVIHTTGCAITTNNNSKVKLLKGFISGGATYTSPVGFITNSPVIYTLKVKNVSLGKEVVVKNNGKGKVVDCGGW